MIAALEKKYSDRVHFVSVDVGNTKDPETVKLIKKYHVSYIPTYIFFDRSGKAVDNYTGAISQLDLEKRIVRLIQ